MIPAIILRKQQQSHHLIALEILPSDPTYCWKAGQWLDFGLDFPQESPLAGYSFCSPAGSGKFSLLIRASSHPVSQWIVHKSKEGDSVRIGKPSGTCVYHPEIHEEIVCFAGGIGITPMISMIRTARLFRKPHSLYLAIRQKEDNVFSEEIPSACVCIGEKLDFKQYIVQHPSSAHYFLCGPRNFIDEGIHILKENNRSNIHFERWW